MTREYLHSLLREVWSRELSADEAMDDLALLLERIDKEYWESRAKELETALGSIGEVWT